MSKKYILTKTDVVDNLTSDVGVLPLSAKQGKTLNDVLVGHTGNTSNPHNVTAAQIGEATWNTLGCVKVADSKLKLYVNANTGDDSNDGLTADTAFKTISHAVDVTPMSGKYATEINIAGGEYTEPTISVKSNQIWKINDDATLTNGGGGYTVSVANSYFEIYVGYNKTFTIVPSGGTSWNNCAIIASLSTLHIQLPSNSHLKIAHPTVSNYGIWVSDSSYFSVHVGKGFLSTGSDIIFENIRYGIYNYGISLLPFHITGATVAEYQNDSACAVTAIAGKWVDQA